MLRAFLVLVLSSYLAACVDSGKRFDDFEDNVIDATPRDTTDATPLDQLPDITGTFYFPMTADIAPTSPFHFRGDLELTRNPDGTGVLDLVLVSLTTAERVPIGDSESAMNVPVNASGQFKAPFATVIPGEANPLSSNAVTVDLDLELTIKDENTACGIAVGFVTAPIELDVTGSIVIGLRVAPGATGDDLPPATTECPEAGAADAGPTDAGTPDAAVPDAA